MVLPEIRLVQSAIILAEELSFSRAGVRLGIDQSALSKRIVELESLLDVRLFERDHQKVELTDAGAKFIEEARKGITHIEEAVLCARAAPRGAEDILHIGRSAYTDPWLASLIRSIQLRLFPGMQIKWSSNYSHEVAHEVVVGTLDLALTTGVPESEKLTCLKLAEHPIYIAMSIYDRLAARADTKSRLVKEFVKATAHKLENLRKSTQPRLPLSA